MDDHQNARLTVHSREQMAKLVLQRGSSLKAAAAAFSVSPKTATKWVRRYREAGSAGLKDLGSKPHRSPRQTPSNILEKVFELRRLRRNGWQIAREVKLSRATVSRILCRAGLNRLRSLDLPPPVVRYEHKHPGERLQQLEPWLHEYNFHRPHASLKLNTPASRSGLNRNNLLSLHI